jgi:probable FeS assembly SUF system protein SufT
VIELKRDITATTIPYGQKTQLPRGSQVEITQELGGSFTVLTDFGLLRVEGKDSDALGRESAAPAAAAAAEMPADAKTVATMVWDQMKTCFDPEIPVNIVELGLVYENKVEPIPEGGFRVDVKFTLTAPGCGMGPVLQTEVRDKVLGIPGVKFANIEVVFEPQWTQAMMSDAAKLQLGMM